MRASCGTQKNPLPPSGYSPLAGGELKKAWGVGHDAEKKRAGRPRSQAGAEIC